MNIERMVVWALAMVSAAGCAPDFPQPDANDPLIGCWQGEDLQPEFQRKTTWFIERKADGSFEVRFDASADGVAPAQSEAGRWTHKAGVYTTRTLEIDGEPVDVKNPDFTDTYRVEFVRDGVVTYHHERRKITFTSEKVVCGSRRA